MRLKCWCVWVCERLVWALRQSATEQDIGSKVAVKSWPTIRGLYGRYFISPQCLRIHIFSDFKKRDFTFFLEMTCQKVVKSR